MQLQLTKLTIGAIWVLSAIGIGVAVGVRSPFAMTVLAAVTLLPPLVMMLLWNEPRQTMAESIQQGRR